MIYIYRITWGHDIITDLGFGVCMFMCCVSVWSVEIKREYTTYSTKRKNLLAEFCQFCDSVQKYNKVHECPLVESRDCSSTSFEAV